MFQFIYITAWVDLHYWLDRSNRLFICVIEKERKGERVKVHLGGVSPYKNNSSPVFQLISIDFGFYIYIYMPLCFPLVHFQLNLFSSLLFFYFWLLKKLMVSTGVAVSYSIQGYNHWDFLSDFLQVDSRANNNSLIEILTEARV